MIEPSGDERRSWCAPLPPSAHHLLTLPRNRFFDGDLNDVAYACVATVQPEPCYTLRDVRRVVGDVHQSVLGSF